MGSHPDLAYWLAINLTSEDSGFKNEALDQFLFLTQLTSMAFNNFVISTHISGGIVLPVVRYGVESGRDFHVIQLRDNFYDFKISVWSRQDITLPVHFLLPGVADRQISPTSCEGFKEADVFSPYVQNRNHFTIELFDRNHVLELFHAVMGI